jgi:hypothetical protein
MQEKPDSTKLKKRHGFRRLLNAIVYARHGRELMGCDSTKLVEVKSPVCKPGSCSDTLT